MHDRGRAQMQDVVRHMLSWGSTPDPDLRVQAAAPKRPQKVVIQRIRTRERRATTYTWVDPR